MPPFDQFCKEVEKLVFGYKKIEPTVLLDVYDGMVEKAEEADRTADELFEAMGIQDKLKLDDDALFNKPEIQKRIKDGTVKYITGGLKNKTLQKDGYCLKENIVGVAVQLRSDDNMLGFISELVEDSSRFVMVDFGDADGAVKIDIGELIY